MRRDVLVYTTAAARGGRRGDRAADRDALRGDVCAPHGLHGQARGRAARRHAPTTCRTAFFVVGTRPSTDPATRRSGADRNRALADQHGVPAGASDQARGGVEQFSTVRPQPQHRRADRDGDRHRSGQAGRAPRTATRPRGSCCRWFRRCDVAAFSGVTSVVEVGPPARRTAEPVTTSSEAERDDYRTDHARDRLRAGRALRGARVAFAIEGSRREPAGDAAVGTGARGDGRLAASPAAPTTASAPCCRRSSLAGSGR